MEVGFPELLPVATQSVRLCRVRPKEKVVVYTDTSTDAAIAEAWYAACVVEGCDVVLIRGQAREVETDPPLPAIAAMTEADVVFDIPSVDDGYAPSLPAIMASGTRVLQILLPRESVIERAPDPENSWRADASELLMKDANEIRVTTPEGTDLRATLARDRPLDVARGYVREAGEWDSYGTDLIAAAPIESSVHGTIVFNGPLILLPQFTFSPQAPIRAEVMEGRITEMAVNDEDGRKLKCWFAQWDDPNAYVFSHVGWGLDPRADLSVYELTACESYDGGVMVAFGSNTGGKLRGTVQSQAHMDGILLGASLWLDDLQIIEDGEFTEASGLRPRSPSTRPADPPSLRSAC